MKTAEQLMKKKGVFKAEMDQMMPKEQSDLLWKKATEKLQSIMDQYGELPSGVRSHTDKIFPAAAIYLTVKESCREVTAFKIVEDGAIKGCAAIQSKVEKLMKLPGMPSFFIKVWDPMTKKMFGASCGFQNVFYPKKKGEYRMDVTACPYFRYRLTLGQAR